MATTRYYFPYTGTAGVTSFTLSDFWNDPATIACRPLVTTKTSTTMTSWNPGLGNTYYSGKYQWVSGALSAKDFTTNDNFKIQFRLADSGSVGTANLAVSIRIMYSTNSERGVLYEGKSSLTIAATDLTNTNMGVTHTHFQNNVSAQANDRLVVEVGFYGLASASGFLSIGDDSATDLGENVTDTAAYNPWLEIITADAAAATNVLLNII